MAGAMPSFVEPMPGTARHQALLREIVEANEHDERVLAIGVLGSIGRGTWDERSDLDLDNEQGCRRCRWRSPATGKQQAARR
jgi:hypothetical protein